MEYENEITVLIENDYKSLHNILTNNGFVIKDKYIANDIYMIDKIIDIYNLDKLEILKNCILVRDLVGMRKELLYKYKKFDAKGNILEQRKVSCPILDIDKAVSFMEQINYIKIFEINDKCIDYSNGKTELTIQLVNDKYIFIEMEDKQRFGNKEYSTIEEMIEEFDSYNLPYKKGNYFVKKAEMMLEEILNK